MKIFIVLAHPSKMLSPTTGGPAPAYVKGGFNGDIRAILRSIQRGMLQFVGFEVLAPQMLTDRSDGSRPKGPTCWPAMPSV
jgi:putative NADPH-quinone reductase